MPKPPMTPADVKAMDGCFKEKQAAESALAAVFRERKPKQEIDEAIRRHEKARQDYKAFTDKFFENYPE